MWAAGDLRVPPEKREEIAGAWGLRRPRKRFRHARRYYRRLMREAEAYRIPRRGTWYDFWHTHPDWRGDGNRSGRDRRRHLQAGFTILRRTVEQTRDFDGPVQVFMLIDALDSSQDGVYIHTPNPNRDNFPCRFENVTWDVPAPLALRELLAGGEWQLGRNAGSPGYYHVRPRGDADACGE